MARILIVEDEAIVAMATKMMLTDLEHHTVAVVSTGEQAIQNSSEHLIDLILMDIKLKGEVDGIIAAHEIRKNQTIPIIFVTGNSDHKTRQRIEEISNVSILQKPVMMDDLEASLKAVLKNIQ